MASWHRAPRAVIPLQPRAQRAPTLPTATRPPPVRRAIVLSARSPTLSFATAPLRFQPAPELKPRCSKFKVGKYLGEGMSRKEAEEKSSAFFMCAEHVRQLGGGSPLPSLVEVKG